MIEIYVLFQENSYTSCVCVFQISMKMLGLRPEDCLSSQEGCLRVSLKPLRLNIDQVKLTVQGSVPAMDSFPNHSVNWVICVAFKLTKLSLLFQDTLQFIINFCKDVSSTGDIGKMETIYFLVR